MQAKGSRSRSQLEHPQGAALVQVLGLLAVGTLGWITGTLSGLDGPAGLQVDARGPVDLVDEREGVDQLAVGAVQHVEEVVAIGMSGQLLVALVVADQLIDTVIVPGVVRRVLIVPDDLTVIRIESQCGGGIEVVTRTGVGVPGRGIARAVEDQVGLGIIGTALPCGCTAGLPQIAGPSGVGCAADAGLLLLAIFPDITLS